MLKTDKPIYNAIFILNLLLLIIAAVFQIFVFFKSNSYTNAVKCVQLLFTMLAIISGFIYAVGGYKKNAALFYKGFMLLFCMASLMMIITDIVMSSINGYGSPISEILSTVICVNLLTLTFAKDIGKKNSLGFAYSIVCVSLVNSIRLMVLYSSINSMITAKALVDIALACIACLFVIEKYTDKAARGTK